MSIVNEKVPLFEKKQQYKTRKSATKCDTYAIIYLLIVVIVCMFYFHNMIRPLVRPNPAYIILTIGDFGCDATNRIVLNSHLTSSFQTEKIDPYLRHQLYYVTKEWSCIGDVNGISRPVERSSTKSSTLSTALPKIRVTHYPDGCVCDDNGNLVLSSTSSSSDDCNRDTIENWDSAYLCGSHTTTTKDVEWIVRAMDVPAQMPW